MILRTGFLIAAAVIACSHAHAAEATMSINFVGDWCYSSQEDKTTSYALPSWTEGGRCTKILSIQPEVFYGEGQNCDPVDVRFTRRSRPLAPPTLLWSSPTANPTDPWCKASV